MTLHERHGDILQRRRSLEDFRVIEAAGVHQHRRDTEQKTKVTHTVDQKGLEVGVDGGRSRVPETDQQIGHQADRFPTEEQLQEVIRHDQHQHAEGEQRDIGKEALIARVVVHVAYGVDVHHPRHEGHGHHHGCGQLIDQEAKVEIDPGGRQPGIEIRVVDWLAAQHDFLEHEQR